MYKNAMEFLLKNLQEGTSGLPSGKVVYRENGWQDYRYAGAGRFWCAGLLLRAGTRSEGAAVHPASDTQKGWVR